MRFKHPFLTSLAGPSAKIAALLFLLVSVHTSLTMTTSLPDKERGARRVGPPMTGTRSYTSLRSMPSSPRPTPPPTPVSDGTSPLSLCLLFQQCQSEPLEGGGEREMSVRQRPPPHLTEAISPCKRLVCFMEPSKIILHLNAA